jgi:hypothetical protein
VFLAAHELYNSNQAPAARDRLGHGNDSLADGKVFIGAGGSVSVFGLLH